MYYYIKGTLTQKGENYAVIDCGGVGYQVFTSMSSLTLMKEIGSSVTVYTYLYVREGIMDLYGFMTPEEKSMFLHLISVSGVGPKVALSILSITTPAKFAVAVITNDIKTIQKAQGVGPKMAQRVILELKDKLKNADLEIDISTQESDTLNIDNKNEAISALIVLGYSDVEAKKAVSGIDSNLDTEEIIKQALKKVI